MELNTDHFYRPQNREELFNVWHASAQNIIEHIFSVLKRKFRILQMVPEYNMSLQAWIPVALAAVHNFIWEHEPEEEENNDDPDDLQPIGGGVGDDDDEAAEIHDGPGQHDDRRDQIAKDMWAQYIDEHLCHGIPLPNI